MTECSVESSVEVVVDLNGKKPIRVLHVDDESSLLRIAKQCLEMQGSFLVDTASSVEEASEKLKKETYDAVVCDYKMPGKDGLEFLKELRQSGNTIPFLIFTGKGREEVAIRALNLGADQYLYKSGDPETVYCELAYAIRRTAERKRAETALKALGEKYKRLFESAVEGILVNESDGKVSSLNQAAAKILGYSSPKELIGKPAVELYADPESRARLLQELMEKGYVKERELTWRKKDGTLIEILASVTVQKDEKGNMLRTEGIIRDITEKKRAEDALRESEEKYKDLFENAMDVILTLDLKGNVTAANSSILRFGYKKEDLVGKNILDFVSKEYWPTVMRDFSQVTQGEPARNETEIVVRTGKMLVEYNARAIVKESNVTGMQINLRDVTERKKVEEAVRSSEAKLRAILASSPEAISVSDLNAKLIDCNEAFLKLHGYLSKEELIGTSWFDVIAPENRFKIRETMGKLLEHGYIKNMEFALLKKRSQEFVGELSASLVLASSGKPTSIVVVARDITERKEMEEKLRESEGRFRDLFESIQDPVGIFIGREGRLIDYNPEFKKLSGYTDEELKDKTFLNFVLPDDHALILEKYQTKYSEEELPLVYEIRGMNKKGESIPLEISVSTYKRKGSVIGIEVIHRNITERKKMEEELKESEERLRNLYESIPDALGVYVGKEGHLIDYNKAFRRSFGYSQEELKDKTFLDFVHPDYHAMLVREYRTEHPEEKLPFRREINQMNKKGEIIPTEISVGPYKKKGSVIGIEVVHRDITERKKAEQKILESQKKFERLFMDNPEPAVYLDHNFHILDVNPRFTTLFDYSLDEVRGKHINDVTVPKEKMEEAEMLDRKATKGIVYHDTVRKRKDGSLIPVSISAAPLIVNNQLLGHVAVYKDVSLLKKTERELAIMNEKLRVVGGLTRHDVRNKLSTITGNIYLNKKRMADHPEVLRNYEDMESACEQIVRIFDFAKDYEMLGAEQLTYVDVENVVQRAVSLFSDLKGVKVANECHGLTVLADSLLRQLYYNLIDNSLKYGEKVTQIRIHYEKTEGDHLKLVYEDDGVGIDRTAKPRLFHEGYTTGKGSGYGLFLARKIMEVYGWSIQETGEPSKGVRFVITIPKTSPNRKENYRIA
jgi:PAS domain S-box-containing protein